MQYASLPYGDGRPCSIIFYYLKIQICLATGHDLSRSMLH